MLENFTKFWVRINDWLLLMASDKQSLYLQSSALFSKKKNPPIKTFFELLTIRNIFLLFMPSISYIWCHVPWVLVRFFGCCSFKGEDKISMNNSALSPTWYICQKDPEISVLSWIYSVMDGSNINVAFLGYRVIQSWSLFSFGIGIVD